MKEPNLNKSLGEGFKKVISRKGFFRNFFMLSGLTIAYGTLLAYVIKYLAPGKRSLRDRLIFIAQADEIMPGETITFSTPNGETYLLTNRITEEGNKFIAFSNRCPHLGCKVIWQNDQNRYYCPCHTGVFNENGIGIGGPPGQAGQNLKDCRIEVKDNALYAIIQT